jgi:hypothetical protein
MSERQESIFIKKYVEILRFKSLVRNQKVKIIKPTKTKKSDEYTPKIKLPYIKVLKNDESPIKRANAQTTSDNNRSNKKNNRYMKEKDNLKTLRGIREINKSTDNAPKKIVKAISDNLYQRLLNNNLKVDNLEKSNSAVNILEELSKDDKEKEKEKRLMIKLPFLSNIKSRYKDYNEANLRKVINRSLNELDIKNDSLRRRPLSKLKVKKLTKNPQKYYYHILPGNNSKLVEKCLLTRPKWEKTSEPENLITCNLIWTELSHEMNFSIHGEIDYSQVVNHFEFHNEISNKKNLFINLLRYCEYNRINLFSFYPLTIILYFKKEFYAEQIEGFKQIYLDLPNMIEGTVKEKDEKSYTDYFRANLVKRVGNVQKIIIPKSNYIGRNTWLLKRTNLNRGRQIKIFSDLRQILNEIEESKTKCNHLIIQKYIEAPALYNNRKFDIRIWVLFTYISRSYNINVYVFKEGHLKACSEPFSLSSDDLYVHLTNYSVQKYNRNFSKMEIGNEISFKTFQEELDKKNANKNFKKDIFPKITKIIAISANSCKNKINILNRNNCFEIFGYDFILDQYYEPFLLEVNTNPGLEESSPLIKMLVPRMIDDAFRLTIDRVFERDDKNKDISAFPVEGYKDEENMWQSVNLRI